MPTAFDFIVLGGGSAGYAAARTARQFVDRVAIIDAAPDLGGLCILRGCMPSKTLIYSAEVLHLARSAEKFGLHIPEARADLPSLLRRKRAMVADFAEYRVSALQSGQFTLFRQRAAFVSPDILRLEDGRELTAAHFVVATGSVVQTPSIPGLLEASPWTSDDILELDRLPASILVLGGGVVACELAQYLARLGSRVTLIQRSPYLLSGFPHPAAEVLAAAFRAEGMQVFTGTRLLRIEKADTGPFRAVFLHGEEEIVAGADHLFNALGRRPATAGLGLDAAGIALAPSGHIACDPYQRTSNPRVYAAGDVAGPDEIVHVAIRQGETAARHALGRPTPPLDHRNQLHVIFTDPQAAFAGLSENRLRAEGIPFLSADYPFADHGKSILMEARLGYVKVFAHLPSGRLLGAECVGKDAGELIHPLQVAIALQASVHDLLRLDWYHPTLSEIWTYPLETLAEQLP